MKSIQRKLLNTFLLLCISVFATAQLTGIKTVGTGGTYPTLAAAIAALNLQGVGAGGVTFNIKGGHTETVASGNTAPNPDIPAGLLITKGGTAANPVLIKWDGTLTKPVFTAGTGVGNFDFVIGIAGQDYITIDGLKIVENPTNGTSVSTQVKLAEMGIALFKEKFNTSTGNNGCQSVTIKNCDITLTRFPNYQVAHGYTYLPTYSSGISVNHFTSTHLGSTSPLVYWALANAYEGIKSAADVHSNNTFIGNTIDNCVFGINMTDGWLKSGVNLYAGTGNVIGQAGAGNTITNFGPAYISGQNYNGSYNIGVAAINVGGQKDFAIEYNTISGCTADWSSSNINMLCGIWAGMSIGGDAAIPRSSSSLFKINNNSVSNIDATNLANNTKCVIGINFTANDNGGERAAGGGNIEIKNNNISNLKAVQGNLQAIGSSWMNNLVTSFDVSLREGYQTPGTVTISGNTISNLTRTGVTRNAGMGAIRWKHGSSNLYIENNKISGLQLGSSTTSPTNLPAGLAVIYVHSSFNEAVRNLVQIKGNKIDNCNILATPGASANRPVAFEGIYVQRGGINNIIKQDTITNCSLFNNAYTNADYYTDLIRVKGQPKAGASVISIDSCILSDNIRTGLDARGYGFRADFRAIASDDQNYNHTIFISNNKINNLSQTGVYQYNAYLKLRGIHTWGKIGNGNVTSIFNNSITNLSGINSTYGYTVTSNATLPYRFALAGIACENWNTLNIFKNNISGLDATSLTLGTPNNNDHTDGAHGIVVYNNTASYNTTANIYNNFVTDLKAPATRSKLAINGIVVSGLAYKYNVYQNTVALGDVAGGGTGRITSSTATGNAWGVTGLLIATYYYNDSRFTTEYRNNIFSVNATAIGTGSNMCVRNLNVTTAKKVPKGTAKTTTGNVYFINQDLKNYIYGQGTTTNASGTGGIRNSYAYSGALVNAANNLVNDNLGSSTFNSQCGLYKTFMAGADKQSYAELDQTVVPNVPKAPPFVNSGSFPNKARLATGAISAAFNATRISTPVDVATDYFGMARGSGKVSSGAHETTGVLPGYIQGIIDFDFAPINDSICGGNKPLAVTITPPTGQAIASGAKAPRLYYRRITNNNSYAIVDANVMPTLVQNVAGTFNGWRWVNPLSNSGNNFNFVVDLSKLNTSVVTMPVYTIEYFLIAETSDGTVCSWSSGDWSLNTATTCPGTVALETYSPQPVPADVLTGSLANLDDNSVQDNYFIYRGQDLTRGIELVNNNAATTITGTTGNTAGPSTGVCIGDSVKVAAHYYVTATGFSAPGSEWQFQVSSTTAFTTFTPYVQTDSVFSYQLTGTTPVYIRCLYSCGGTAVTNSNTPYVTITPNAVPVNSSTTANENSCENQARTILLSSTATPTNLSRYYWLVSPKGKIFANPPVANTTGSSSLGVTPGDTAHNGTWTSYITPTVANVLNKQGVQSSLLDGSESAGMDTSKGLAIHVNSFIKLKNVTVKAQTGDATTTDGFRVSLYSSTGYRLYTLVNPAAIADGALKTLALTNWYIAPGDYVLVMETEIPGTDPTGQLVYTTPDFPINSPGTGTDAFQITGGVSDLVNDDQTGFGYSTTEDNSYFFDLDVDAYCTSNPATFEWAVNPASCCAASPSNPVVATIPVGTSSSNLSTTSCKLVSGWYYYFDPANPAKLLAAVHPNGNPWSPTTLSIDNSVLSRDASIYQQFGTDSASLMPYMLTVNHGGTVFGVNGGIKVKFFYPYQSLDSSNLAAASSPVNSWIKASGSRDDLLAAFTSAGLDPSYDYQTLTPVSSGNENGINYVQFDDITSLSTFAHLSTKTTPAATPDLTVTTIMDDLNFDGASVGVTRDFVVVVSETNNGVTTGDITFEISKLSAFDITYPTVSGTSDVNGGTANVNSDWTFTETPTKIIAKTFTHINNLGSQVLGFKIARKVGVPFNTTQSNTIRIQANTGGEGNVYNNIVVTSVSTN